MKIKENNPVKDSNLWVCLLLFWQTWQDILIWLYLSDSGTDWWDRSNWWTWASWTSWSSWWARTSWCCRERRCKGTIRSRTSTYSKPLCTPHPLYMCIMCFHTTQCQNNLPWRYLLRLLYFKTLLNNSPRIISLTIISPVCIIPLHLGISILICMTPLMTTL